MIIEQKKLCYQKAQLFVNCINSHHQFESLDRTSIWKILRQYGIPKLVINIVKSLYDGGGGNVMYKGKLSDLITGVRKDCFISPFLFLLVNIDDTNLDVNSPEYLGSKIDELGWTEADVKSKVNKSKINLCQSKQNLEFQTSLCSNKAKTFHIKCYGAKTWFLNEHQLQTYNNKCLRRIQKIFWPNNILNKNLFWGGEVCGKEKKMVRTHPKKTPKWHH